MDITQNTQGEGVILKPLSSEEEAKLLKSRLRKACFTLNNWKPEEFTQLLKVFKNRSIKYVIGKEVADSGTPHLQGYVEFGRQYSHKQCREMIPRAHIERAKGTRKQNVVYCSKEGNFVTNFPVDLHIKLMKKYADVVWKPWQQKIIDIVDGPTDDRKIYWFHEDTGNVGKSFLTKYLFLKYDAIIGSGKKNDIFNQILTWMAQECHDQMSPTLILLDVPRHNIGYINYGAIEEIKNGLMYSGKYEGGCCAFESPKVIIFANSMPDTSTMSKDRWIVERIN